MSAPGFVYVLTNMGLPDLVKVGMSHNVDRRLTELNTGAGVAGRWLPFGMLLVADMHYLEKRAHQDLAKFRMAGSVGTEVFSCSAEEAARAIVRQALECEIKIYENLFPIELTREEEIKAKEEKVSLTHVMDQVCHRFPDVMLAWVNIATASEGRGTQSALEKLDGPTRSAMGRLASILRSWGLVGHEERLYRHASALIERERKPTPSAYLAYLTQLKRL